MRPGCNTGIRLFAAWAVDRVFGGRIAFLHRGRGPGGILWVSGPLPGAVHDLTTTRIWGIVAELAASTCSAAQSSAPLRSSRRSCRPLPFTAIDQHALPRDQHG